MTTHHDDFKLLQLFYFHEIMMNAQFCNQYCVLTEVKTQVKSDWMKTNIQISLLHSKCIDPCPELDILCRY